MPFATQTRHRKRRFVQCGESREHRTHTYQPVQNGITAVVSFSLLSLSGHLDHNTSRRLRIAFESLLQSAAQELDGSTALRHCAALQSGCVQIFVLSQATVAMLKFSLRKHLPLKRASS